ncbi:MAG: hypothetical protein HN919_18590 [Verrucomicrobia bacterium]|jgi:hypothetical protein|nr:hypothetical protein [Verrucomicrobiota bacterium]MBT7068312.1 hypothetical protein [Verrucomicrobiota bacterium]MBT7702349.1 hypothetical protein [Verrucomicrobiota bacterium]
MMTGKIITNGLTVAVVAMGILGLTAGTIWADPVTVVNHSFEEGADGSGANVNQPPWARAGNPDTNNGIPIQELAGLGADVDPAPDGTDTSHYSNAAVDNIYQVLVATLAANATYTLRVDLGDRNALTAQPGEIRLGYVSASPTTDKDYGLNLLTAVVVNDTVPVNGGGASDGWQTWESTFTTGPSPAGLGQPLRIELVTLGGVQTLWDNARLEVSGGGPAATPGTLIYGK